MELEDRGEEEDWSNFYNFTNKEARWPAQTSGESDTADNIQKLQEILLFHNSYNKFLFVYSFLHIFTLREISISKERF